MTTALPRTRPDGTARVIAALAVGLTLGLTSCTDTPVVTSDQGAVTPSSGAMDPGSAPPSEQAGDSPPATPAPATAPATGPTTGPASAEEGVAGIARTVDAELTALADSGDAVTSARVRAAIEEGFALAGATPASVEVSIDTTPTGLDVDAIQGAGLIDGTCVFGEVRDGSVTVTVLPVLGSGLCFVGDQR
ncbi:DUF6993 domain-containing protein [Arthrobacter sp. TMS2-4]